MPVLTQLKALLGCLKYFVQIRYLDSKLPDEPSAIFCYGDEGNGISSGLLRPMTGVPMNRVFHRVGLPSLEAAEQFISATPADWPADVAEDLRERISNFTQLNRGLFEVVRAFG